MGYPPAVPVALPVRLIEPLAVMNPELEEGGSPTELLQLIEILAWLAFPAPMVTEHVPELSPV
jgi:hypothetical protein